MASPLFSSFVICSFHFMPNCFTGLLLLLSAPPFHWLPPQAFYLPLSPALLHYALSSLLRSLRQSFECHFFLHLLSLPAFLWKYQEFIGFSVCPCQRMSSVPFLPEACGGIEGSTNLHKSQLKGQYYFYKYYVDADLNLHRCSSPIRQIRHERLDPPVTRK